jgi:molecular chaperone GrpE (heat shock protein)
MKLLMNTETLQEPCKTCDKIVIKYNKIRKEEDNIRRWRRESNRKASIEKSESLIDDLLYSIEKLERDRTERRNRLN